MSWKDDTLVPEAQASLDEDPNNTATGEPLAPGGKDATQHSQRSVTYGQETGPGDQKGDPNVTSSNPQK